MNTSTDTTVRIKRASLQRLRVIAAKRGTSHGVLLNAILADKDALLDAIYTLDAKANLESTMGETQNNAKAR